MSRESQKQWDERTVTKLTELLLGFHGGGQCAVQKCHVQTACIGILIASKIRTFVYCVMHTVHERAFRQFRVITNERRLRVYTKVHAFVQHTGSMRVARSELLFGHDSSNRTTKESRLYSNTPRFHCDPRIRATHLVKKFCLDEVGV